MTDILTYISPEFWIWYDTRCYFYVCSYADISQCNVTCRFIYRGLKSSQMRLTAENKNVFSFDRKGADTTVQHSQFRRQTVLYTWASQCKVPGADGSTSPWNVQGSGVGGPQRTSTSHRRHKNAVVGEVGRCQVMEALKNNQRQLEPHGAHAVPWQTMEFVQHWRDVVEPSWPHHNTRCGVLHRLQLPQQPITDAIQHTVAVVESAADERVYECLSRVVSQWRPHKSKLAQLKKTRPTQSWDVISHAQLTIDEHSEVRQRRRELHACRQQR